MVEFRADDGADRILAWSPDEARIAAPLHDRTVRVWDAATGSPLATLRGHTDLAFALAYSLDGTTIATAGYDRTLRLWGPRGHRVLRGATAPLISIAWLDDARLATASRDGLVQLWTAPPTGPPTLDELRARIRAATTARIVDGRPVTAATPSPP